MEQIANDGFTNWEIEDYEELLAAATKHGLDNIQAI